MSTKLRQRYRSDVVHRCVDSSDALFAPNPKPGFSVLGFAFRVSGLGCFCLVHHQLRLCYPRSLRTALANLVDVLVFHVCILS